mmetsp:Transcript_33672/g.46623  ORF Transcript_33672/g.46623 Transcript_33672/m.46623 type:complete len:201 (-) Transcript_33672:102-704(-)
MYDKRQNDMSLKSRLLSRNELGNFEDQHFQSTLNQIPNIQITSNLVWQNERAPQHTFDLNCDVGVGQVLFKPSIPPIPLIAVPVVPSCLSVDTSLVTTHNNSFSNHAAGSSSRICGPHVKNSKKMLAIQKIDKMQNRLSAMKTRLEWELKMSGVEKKPCPNNNLSTSTISNKTLKWNSVAKRLRVNTCSTALITNIDMNA